MSTIFPEKGYRGFTLIELLVVIAIIGLLSTVIAAPIQSARAKSRDAKRVAEIKSIISALDAYATDNAGVYPNSLDGLVGKYLQNLPPNAATTTPAADKYMYVTYVESGRNIGYHLGVKLEAGNPGLTGDVDCGGVLLAPLAGNVACVGLSTQTNKLPLCSGACTIQNSNYSASGAGNPAATAATTDFGGADTGGPCTASLTSCVYDVLY